MSWALLRSKTASRSYFWTVIVQRSWTLRKAVPYRFHVELKVELERYEQTPEYGVHIACVLAGMSSGNNVEIT